MSLSLDSSEPGPDTPVHLIDATSQDREPIIILDTNRSMISSNFKLWYPLLDSIERSFTELDEAALSEMKQLHADLRAAAVLRRLRKFEDLDRLRAKLGLRSLADAGHSALEEEVIDEDSLISVIRAEFGHSGNDHLYIVIRTAVLNQGGETGPNAKTIAAVVHFIQAMDGYTLPIVGQRHPMAPPEEDGSDGIEHLKGARIQLTHVDGTVTIEPRKIRSRNILAYLEPEQAEVVAGMSIGELIDLKLFCSYAVISDLDDIASVAIAAKVKAMTGDEFEIAEGMEFTRLPQVGFGLKSSSASIFGAKKNKLKTLLAETKAELKELLTGSIEEFDSEISQLRRQLLLPYEQDALEQMEADLVSLEHRRQLFGSPDELHKARKQAQRVIDDTNIALDLIDADRLIELFVNDRLAVDKAARKLIDADATKPLLEQVRTRVLEQASFNVNNTRGALIEELSSLKSKFTEARRTLADTDVDHPGRRFREEVHDRLRDKIAEGEAALF